MAPKVKLFIYLIMWSSSPLICAQILSPLAPIVWQATLSQQASLGATGDALIALGQRDPLFFGNLLPRVLAEGVKRHGALFESANPELMNFVLQEFEVLPEGGFREGVLSVAPQLSQKTQVTLSQRELAFLISRSPEQSRLRRREVQLWIQLTRPLPFAKESFLMLYARTQEPAIRYFLWQAARFLKD